MNPITRRGVVAAGAALPAAGLVAACGGSEDDQPDPSATQAPDIATGELIGRVGDVPVGGCAVFPDFKVVVTQPSEGDFKAFGAKCTHKGCLVSSSSDGDIPCLCHMSRFSLEDGSVISGPAKAPLPAVEITVDGDDLRTV